MPPHIDTDLVRALVDYQFPQWASLPLRRLEQAGSDHVIHRLGDDLTVRLPRHDGAIGQAVKEQEWLPRLAPALPLPIPFPVAVGAPRLDYPWSWAVTRWLPGEVATVAEFGDSLPVAEELAGFLAALHAFPLPSPSSGPSSALSSGPAALSPSSGPAAPGAAVDLADRPLVDRDESTRRAITALAGEFDVAAMTRIWDEALEAGEWSGPPLWHHGDFHVGNLLSRNGRISAVIDFGGLGIGDPACDLMMPFSLMSEAPRKLFRATLGLDDATWARGRGWALTGAVIAHTAYAATDARVAAATTRQITQALAG